MPQIKIYTDGSCLGNPGPGGWGSIIIVDDKIKEMSGGAIATTNNRMEMIAFLKSLQLIARINKSAFIDFYIDSKYVIDGTTKWGYNWQKNNYRNSKGTIANDELWREILPLYNRLIKTHKINLHWVKGHSGNKFNEKVDKLARKEAEKLM